MGLRVDNFKNACLEYGAVPLIFTDDVMHFTFTALVNGKIKCGKVWCAPYLSDESIKHAVHVQLEKDYESGR